MINPKFSILSKKALLLGGLLFIPQLFALAQEAATAPATPAAAPMNSYDLARYILTGMSVLLLFVIAMLGNAVIGAGKIYWSRQREQKGRSAGKAALLAGLISLAAVNGAHAEEAAAAAETVAAKGPAFPTDLYFLLIVVSLEFAVVLILVRMLFRFLGLPVQTPATEAKKRFDFKKFFQKVNQTVPLADEDSLDMAHDYDGIRELDNKVPAWWRYAFYASILFGVVYLYRMFGTGSIPDQITELNTANEIAAAQQAEYLKNAANNVDENNVAMLDAAGIAEGGALYAKNCVACHGDKGQGGVGPNLTDDYWLHKGGIKDVFHSIKYGWPEKGMKSWKDDFSPAQIAQLASYVKSLHGSNPPAAKEQQGELYTEESATATAATDTTNKKS
ncbi:cbb3-type cytochrome c oxidase N-terminal domain-containing protein [Taibaiella chishuiensis]|uniref:Cytochrome c oxidase cbb3-type subunit 3 n=1 Tax=Taibaiella chishuiensis TaxID=1434707 RepID=A0A2P8CZU6_9BACT|nr:cbb3-type cytochrome c oxidase N-terminal domain-containing protein [Taibaiella chishuiensis]PSK90446.1 cytochrome c oxidase cbb3-type subunit 3 [Taibaiella chishuiensis]